MDPIVDLVPRPIALSIASPNASISGSLGGDAAEVPFCSKNRGSTSSTVGLEL